MLVRIKETGETVEAKYNDGQFECHSEVLQDTVLLNSDEFEIVENIKKLFTCRVTEPYAGGMCLIAADNIKDAKKAVEEDTYYHYKPHNVEEVDGAFIKTSCPYPYIIEEGSYYE